MPAAAEVRLVISYHRDSSRSPRSGPAAQQDLVYWKDIAVSAATFRHVSGPDPAITVFSGEEPPHAVRPVLERAAVEVRTLGFARRPPDDFYVRYVGSLYLLDAMAALASEASADEVLLLADPDIAWVADPGPLVDEVRRGGTVAYDLGVPDSIPMCDLTRVEQGELLAELTGAGPGPGEPAPTHFGGELYGITGAELADVVPAVEVLWDETMERYRSGLRHHTVEEHLMNAVLWQRGEHAGRANRFIERIRTLPRPMGTRERARPGLVAWHLPIEKDRGFLEVFDDLAGGGVLPDDPVELQRWLARRLGVSPSPRRWLADRARQARWLATGRWWTRGAAARYGL